MRPVYEDVGAGGLRVARSGGVYLYRAAANQQLARAESIWGPPRGASQLTMGLRVIYSFDIQARLGSPGPSVWQTVSQLHGPTSNGAWLGPPVALVIESGLWRIAGGYATPNDRGRGYTKRVAPVRPNTWQHWTFDVRLGGPGKGSVTAWLDGTMKLNAFKPPRGTMYTAGEGYGHAYLQLKTGLYTAAGNRGETPTWQRTVLIKNVKSNIM